MCYIKIYTDWFKLNIDQIISLWDMWNKKSMFSWNSGKKWSYRTFSPLQMSTTQWQRDFFKIKMCVGKELKKKYMPSCVYYTFFFDFAENPG